MDAQIGEVLLESDIVSFSIPIPQSSRRVGMEWPIWLQ